MSDPVTPEAGANVAEYCPRCGDETSHAVDLKIQASTEEKYSRQPHRISRCRQCGRTVEARVGY
jgi:uncharacterized protein with PIN domain